jgi:Rrf2 family iron-sulfur cluster assembly transcriptional regulator
MRLTTKGRFAVTAMIDVALYGRTGPVNLASISLRQQISLSYLELLFAKLRRHQLVESTRGPGGGYSLGRRPAEISVADIVLSIDDDPVSAKRARGAPSSASRLATDELWASVNLRAVEFLQSITLQSLIDEQKAKGVPFQSAKAPVRKRVLNAEPQKPQLPNVPNSVFALGSMVTKS